MPGGAIWERENYLEGDSIQGPAILLTRKGNLAHFRHPL